MASIGALLNPVHENPTSESSSVTSSSSISSPCELNPSSQPRKKQKLCKDAAVFTKGPIRGECRYPPHEPQDEILKALQKQFEIYPLGEIAEYPRHIPYNSEKNSLLPKTNLFQYQFKAPGDEQIYSMLWDYNIGLVRTTPLFKCTGYSKTTPAKMLNRNPGLRDICHSITGGALVAQGYWMPYEAAKAVAATFCWKIRFALVPVFGTEFPSMCLEPKSEGFANMLIDPTVTKRCAEEADMYRELEVQKTSHPTPGVTEPLTPDTPDHPKTSRPVRHKALKSPQMSDCTSSYSPEIDSDDSYSLASASPNPGFRNLWTPVNTPRSVPRSEQHLPSPRDVLSDLWNKAHIKPVQIRGSAKEAVSPSVSPRTIPLQIDSKQITYGDNEESFQSPPGNTGSETESSSIISDDSAAYILLDLKFQKPVIDVVHGLGVIIPLDKLISRKREASL